MLNTALILAAIVLIFASFFRSTIKLCKKDKYKTESIKYVSFKSYKSYSFQSIHITSNSLYYILQYALIFLTFMIFMKLIIYMYTFYFLKLIFVLMIHLCCEFNLILSLYFTLYSKREPHLKKAKPKNDYQSSTYDDRSNVFSDVEVVARINPMMQDDEQNISKVKQLGY